MPSGTLSQISFLVLRLRILANWSPARSSQQLSWQLVLRENPNYYIMVLAPVLFGHIYKGAWANYDSDSNVTSQENCLPISNVFAINLAQISSSFCLINYIYCFHSWGIVSLALPPWSPVLVLKLPNLLYSNYYMLHRLNCLFVTLGVKKMGCVCCSLSCRELCLEKIYMLFHGQEVRIEKNFARGLKCTARAASARAVHSRQRAKFSRYGPTKAGK